MAGLHGPCRRFDDSLAAALARLGVDVDRYSFIAVDLHHLLFAGLPALQYGFSIQRCTTASSDKLKVCWR
ncbi:hypothetical protein [Microvirga arsenatis]|uniref:Uncharacterized protein n=1 Tax=Microvirga arsenatis TaxID=2692265 RepID=A0ABW9Z5T4_9HYPH|nr:hypothetical protein [Microvirga arsenatis]NBJ13582.1 hypothetical protein [Microvirga arsenatis]NBJ27055.1 hypothetical protein [Microvirga arsenatis]